MNLTPHLLSRMRDPRISLVQCGKVLDLQTKAFIPYDPTHITNDMQVDVLSYWAHPPKDEDNYSLFMNVLKGRQSGNSFAVEACAYVTTGFTPGHDHTCLADTRERADYLHNRIHALDRRWPTELRPDRLNMRERLQMTFDPLTGGTMRTQSLHMGNVGIGQNPGSVHWCLPVDAPVIDPTTGSLVPLIGATKVRTHTGAIASVKRQIMVGVKPIVRINLKQMTTTPLVCTPQHKVFTDRGFVPAGELKKGDRIGFPLPTVVASRSHIPFAVGKVQEKEIVRKDSFAGMPAYIPADYQLGWFLGYYLAEGSVGRQTKPPCRLSMVVLSVDRSKVESVVSRLKKMRLPCRSNGISYSKTSRTAHIRLYGRALAEFVEEICGSVDGKHWPDSWWQLGNEFGRGMIHGYIEGDGYIDVANRMVAISSVRPGLVVSLRDALASLGYGWASLYERSYEDGRGWRSRPRWNLNLCGQGATELAAEMGVTFAPRKREPRSWATVKDDTAWIQVLEVEDAGSADVMDIEVDHPDHSFTVLQGAVSNSEVPFADDQAAQWSAMLPGLMPQNNVRVVCESTANPDDTEGFWQDHYLSGVHRDGRLFSKFYPYWDCKANVRTWKPEWGEGEAEEQRLMERYGPLGLTWANLAFRRHVIANDRRIRLNPEEFGIWYPFDDVTCWAKGAGGIIGSHLLSRHLKSNLVPWQPVSMLYPGDDGRIGPCPRAAYVLGVDPCGYAARDHGAAQLLEVWDDRWYQVGAFSGGKQDNVGPEQLARWAFDTGKRFNGATIWVESNGVGQLVIGLLKEWGYPNIAHESWGKPGIAATTRSVDKALTFLQTALLDTLVLQDADSVAQLQTYKNDKQVQDGIKAEQLRGDVGKRRRQRHHWDKVSALQWAVWGARKAPNRIRVQPDDPNLQPWTAPDTPTINIDFAKKKWTEIQNRLSSKRRRPDHWKTGGKWH